MPDRSTGVSDTTPVMFGELPEAQRKLLRDKRLQEAQWRTRDLEAGDVIFQLRRRADESQYRARIFLFLLFASVVAGLAYFVGLPIYQGWAREQEEAQVVAAITQIATEQSDLTAEVAAIQGAAQRKVSDHRSWARVSSSTRASLSAVHFANASNGWAVGRGGTIVATVDAGKTWRKQPSNTTIDLLDVFFVNPNVGWAVGDNGVVLQTLDGGEIWTPPGERPDPASGENLERWQSFTRSSLVAVQFVSEETGWVASADWGILVTRDGGVTWDSVQEFSSPENVRTIADMSVANGRVPWIVSPDGTIAELDRGARDLVVRFSSSLPLSATTFLDEDRGWAVGQRGLIYWTRDGGLNWKGGEHGIQDDLNDIEFFDFAHGWAVGENGTLLSTKDSGVSWTRENSGTGQHLRSVHFANRDQGWAVGDNGTILTFANHHFDTISEAIARAFIQTRPSLRAGAPPETFEVITPKALKRVLESAQQNHGFDFADELRRLATASEKEKDLEKRKAITDWQVQNSRSFEMFAVASPISASDTDELPVSTPWWQELTKQLPAGVLLLFLLSTLSSLYRHSSRMGSFYHGRADALELMALDLDEERTDRLASTLGADKVDFKTSKTPAEMATEITKEVIAKMNLTPKA